MRETRDIIVKCAQLQKVLLLVKSYTRFKVILFGTRFQKCYKACQRFRKYNILSYFHISSYMFI